MKLSAEVKHLIQLALKEDIGKCDITSELIIPKNSVGTASIIAKESGIICGMQIVAQICKAIDKKLSFNALSQDGERVSAYQKIATINGPLKSLLTVERTILNFLQRMSGIASEANKYAAALRGTNTKLLDTRKTVPGHRALDKYAVKIGGGVNHRFGLFDMILIKENHIAAAGNITEAVKRVLLNKPKNMKVEVEVTNMKEVEEALTQNIDIIMLDNMNASQIKKSLQVINDKCKTEASGGITLKNIRQIAKTGVNYISVGAITHSVKALDIAMYIQQTKMK
ncbi:MAG: nicotinate-nucleotide pyrophosphorylase [Stygiobacter sp.]|nr:MAG: nicotinate-nucleotide pyrophosphorylase [Stygiobacter sp.]KAF0217850.1 MAG: nicotinate-nucleotide [Ignavibacteria bacterium]